MKQKLIISARLTTAAILCAFVALPAGASSHREAPFVTEHPKVDGTDFYMFRSYQPGREGFVTLIADYLPLQDAYGGPNYFSLDPDARYRINIDNSGDGKPNMVFEFDLDRTLADIKVDAGGVQVSIPLKEAGQVTDVASEANLNFFESYTVTLKRSGGSNHKLINLADGTTRFDKPMDYIGKKTFPDYAGYAARFMYDVGIPGCADGRVFVGQRNDPFAVNLGEVFDLVNVGDPLGSRRAEPDALEDKNITAFILEVPIECLTDGWTDVIGGWTTAHLRKTRKLRSKPSFDRPDKQSGSFVQVSRIGMPLVNEVVIGLKDKDRFNASKPSDDAQFATYVTNPAFAELLEILFGAAGVQAPNNFPRRDLLATFITGIAGLNEFGFGEMQRLNVTIDPTPRGSQNSLGVIGGDLAGYPNGRRPGDDSVDITLRVTMGLLCHAFPGAYCDPADAPSGLLPFTDGTQQKASQFDNKFPYLRTPVAGSPN